MSILPVRMSRQPLRKKAGWSGAASTPQSSASACVHGPRPPRCGSSSTPSTSRASTRPPGGSDRTPEVTATDKHITLGSGAGRPVSVPDDQALGPVYHILLWQNIAAELGERDAASACAGRAERGWVPAGGAEPARTAQRARPRDGRRAGRSAERR